MQAESGLEPKPVASEPDAQAVDWPRARIGDGVRAPGGGRATLLSLPDRKGRVSIRVAGAKVSVSRDQLTAQSDPGPRPPASKRAATREPRPPVRIGGIVDTDLRGLRVDEALDRLDTALDLAVAEGRDEMRIIHGIGTGALRKAVLEYLPRSRYVVESAAAAREEGGAGATRAILRKD